MPENPYPGLRPFRRDEAHLFFGRDEQTDHLLDKLAQTRFITVTGLSGSGKSSLRGHLVRRVMGTRRTCGTMR